MIVSTKKVNNKKVADLSNVPYGYEVVHKRYIRATDKFELTLQWQGNCPEQVANWKLSAVLEAQGYMEVIQPMIDQSPSIVQKAWNDAPTIRRASPMIIEFADRLDLSDDEVDGLFTEAAKIQI